MGKQWKQWETIFWAPKSLQMVIVAMKLKDVYSLESYDQPRQHIQKQRHYFANKGLSSQGYGFSSGHVQMWGLDCKESWAPKNWCFWTVVLETTLEVPWTAMRLNQSILKEISPGCSLEGLMLKLKLQYFGHLMPKYWEFQPQYQSFQYIFRTDLLEDGLVGSSCSPRDSQESSFPTPQFEILAYSLYANFSS